MPSGKRFRKKGTRVARCLASGGRGVAASVTLQTWKMISVSPSLLGSRQHDCWPSFGFRFLLFSSAAHTKMNWTVKLKLSFVVNSISPVWHVQLRRWPLFLFFCRCFFWLIIKGHSIAQKSDPRPSRSAHSIETWINSTITCENTVGIDKKYARLLRRCTFLMSCLCWWDHLQSFHSFLNFS